MGRACFILSPAWIVIMTMATALPTSRVHSAEAVATSESEAGRSAERGEETPKKKGPEKVPTYGLPQIEFINSISFATVAATPLPAALPLLVSATLEITKVRLRPLPILVIAIGVLLRLIKLTPQVRRCRFRFG